MTREEAIKRIKTWNLDSDVMEVLAVIIPELRESEDEKLRKLVIYRVRTATEMTEGLRELLLAYLEKQKGPDLAEEVKKWKKDFDHLRKEHYGQKSSVWESPIITHEMIMDEQKEQKPAECIEFANEFENQVSHLIASVLNGEHEYNEGFVKYVAQSLLEFAKKEQKPISQEDFDTAKHEATCGEHKPNYTEDMPYITDEHFYERAPADSFKYKLAEYMTKGCTKKEGPYGYTYAISAETILKMAEEELLKRGVVQKPDIALIQRSWYMEGYHDREFGQEPKWIMKTGEGGPKYELNPNYGKKLVEEQKPKNILTDKDTIQTAYCKGQTDVIEDPEAYGLCKKPEWSEEDEYRIRQIERIAQEAGCTQKLQEEIHDWLKSLRPQLKREVTDEEIEEMAKERATKSGTTKSEMAFYRNGIKAAIKRFGLRPSWKPSEEQMEALAYAIQILDDGISPKAAKAGEELEHLREQLKKL